MNFAISCQSIEQLNGFNKNLEKYVIMTKENNAYKMQEDIYMDLIKKLKNRFQNLNCEYLYFGSEFCENLIVNLEEIKKVLGFCKNHNLKLVLVTPLVSNKGIESLKKIFDYLKEKEEKIEVVVNDYGVMKLIDDKYENLTMVAGRTFHKMTSDPRIKKYIDNLKKIPLDLGILKYMKSSAYSMINFIELMNDFKINHGELDAVYQGLDINEIRDFTFSLNVPYTYITSGRYCVAGSMNVSNKDKFDVNLKCRKECKNFIIRMNNSEIEEKIFRRGKGVVNTMYSNINLDEYVNKKGITRIVIAPFITY